MNGLKILSLQSCDIYECNKVKESYVIDNLNNKYGSMLDDSLDLRYLTKNKEFKTFKDDGLIATNDIINVRFRKIYKNEKNPNKNKNGFELREFLYTNGFKLDINGTIIEYTRYKRSSGSSREGKCLFIKKSLYAKMNKWSLCGLNENNQKIQNDLVSFEAYKALSLSGIIDTIEIKPESILLVDDFNFTFKTKCINVKKVKEGKEEIVTACEEEAEVTNNIWDGEGLLDESFFVDKYKDKGMMYLRNRFFKGCVFNTKLQEFFNENNITDISMLNGETIATDIKDIKLVITKSCLKYLKFGTFKNWLKKVGTEFGIIKVDEPSHFFGGKMIMTTYQFLNTLHLSWDDVKELIEDEVKYLDYLRNDPDMVRFHIRVNKATHKNNINDNENEDIEDLSTIYKKGVITLKLLRTNPDFKNTTMYYNFVTENINSLINRMRFGKVLINGTYTYLFGNGYELLLNTIGKFDKNNPKSIIDKDTVMTTFYDDDVDITASRNPHITIGNILMAKNKYYDEYKKWFKLTKQIICVNAIGENIQQRLNGCDYDSDNILITNNPLINKVANNHYLEFGVPVCGFKETKKEEKNLANIDHNIQNNQIGNIVNLSQWLNSILWDKYNKDEDISGIYNDICILAVLSGCEIDKAKREYGINAISIINIIRDKYKKEYENEPKILKLLKEKHNKDKKNKKDDTKGKNKVNTKESILLQLLSSNNDDFYYDTAMDYLIGQVNEIRIKKVETVDYRPSILELMNNIQRPGGPNYNNKDSVIPIIENAYNNIKELKDNYKYKKSNNDDDNIDREQLKALISNEYKNAMQEIGRKLDSAKTVKLIIQELYDRNKTKLFWDTLYYVLKKKQSVFDECFKKEGITFDMFPRIIEDEDGDINLFGIKYIKDMPIAKVIKDPDGKQLIFGEPCRIEYYYKKRKTKK
ncbi:MAG: hypothetical protein IKP77_06290 [Acholeplasmatales bacterium]|nr:hypothetical protein [Acholeplasmatales bacterium]